MMHPLVALPDTLTSVVSTLQLAQSNRRCRAELEQIGINFSTGMTTYTTKLMELVISQKPSSHK